MSQQLEVGDVVRVIGLGGVYTSYASWSGVRQMPDWCPYENPVLDGLYKIIVINKHSIEREDDILLGIESIHDNKRQFIISNYKSYVTFVRKSDKQFVFNF